MASQQPKSRNRICWLLLAATCLGAASWQAAPAPSQAQVAYHFLRDVLSADYPAAYRRLAPEVSAKLGPTAFAAAARPLHQQGARRGRAIALYTLGTHLSERGGREPWFYRFSFARDSLQKSPPVLLEVTFRDTATRQVLGFRVRARP